MPGFLGYFKNNMMYNSFSSEKRTDLIIDLYHHKDFYIENRTLNKFLNDKCFIYDENYFCVIDGVILNTEELKFKYKVDSLYKIVIASYETEGEIFFKQFRGSFSGFLYDNVSKKALLFTDHISSKQLFYSVNETFSFGSEINYIIDFYKNNNISYSLNEQGAFQLLTYGFLHDNHTLFADIKRLPAGYYLKFIDNKYDLIQYHQFDNSPNLYNSSVNDIIENVDYLFRNSIKQSFDKDNEYSYKHIAALSAGLDSRMTTWIAKDMGYDNIVNYTFSQSDYYDEKTAKKIASDLNNEWIFKFLDNGLCMLELDSTVSITSGNVSYFGQAHGKSCIDLINFNKFGILHSGQLGDVILGTYFESNDYNVKYSNFDGAVSRVLEGKVEPNGIREYPNQEIFKFYTRGFRCILQGNLPIQEYTETISPFNDIDFMEYCLKIPLKYRFNKFIYDQWILKKYPAATKYLHNGKRKIGEYTIIVSVDGKDYPISPLKLIPRGIDYLLRKIGLKKSAIATVNNMNPFLYWYNSSPIVKSFIDNYFKENLHLLEKYPNLYSTSKLLFKNYGIMEKSQVLTLLSAIKIYFK